jgi:hypothetical protein
MDEPVSVFSIGSIVGGPTSANRPWREAITSLTRRIAAARIGCSAPLNVNVVFQVPGDVLQPDFVGVRTGRFSRKDPLLMVQVAVPIDVPGDIEQHLAALTYAAIEEAARWAEKRRLPCDISVLRGILERAEQGHPRDAKGTRA